jgi:hypothetical protein
MKTHSTHTSHTSHTSYLLVTPLLIRATPIVSSFPSFGGVPRRGGVVAIPRSKISGSPLRRAPRIGSGAGLVTGPLPHHRTCGFPHTAVESGSDYFAAKSDDSIQRVHSCPFVHGLPCGLCHGTFGESTPSCREHTYIDVSAYFRRAVKSVH